MKTKYLSEVIGTSFQDWGNRKVLITAPTGMGKTTFIVKVLLPHLRKQGKKLLILCNRKLLRQQYWYDLVGQCNNFADLQESVQLMTYQELATKINQQYSVIELLSDFDSIVCDEAHFFYADSDFNAFGTFALLQMLVYAGMSKNMIFLSATMQEVNPILTRTIRNCWEMLNCRRELKKFNVTDTSKEIVLLDYSVLVDYQRFQCLCMPDESALYTFLENSAGKSILFIDNKEKGFKMRERLVKDGKMDSQEVALLNADNIDSPTNSELVRQLTIGHRLIPKILITTTVLDNGVSLHDPEIGNIVIITESKIGFLQMLGRVRAEAVDECNLVFLSRNADVFMKRMNSYKQKLEDYERLEHTNLNRQMRYFENIIWENNSEIADFYRTALVKMAYHYQCYTLPDKVHASYSSGGQELYINQFAKRKTGDMYLTESRFYSKAVIDPLYVIYEQMSWIGKEPYELWVEKSHYLEEHKQQFIDDLLSVQDYTHTELADFKQKLVSKYRRDFFNDVPAKNGTLSLEKLKMICERMGLIVEEKLDSEKRTKTYSICRTVDEY